MKGAPLPVLNSSETERNPKLPSFSSSPVFTGASGYAWSKYLCFGVVAQNNAGVGVQEGWVSVVGVPPGVPSMEGVFGRVRNIGDPRLESWCASEEGLEHAGSWVF